MDVVLYIGLGIVIGGMVTVVVLANKVLSIIKELWSR